MTHFLEMLLIPVMGLSVFQLCGCSSHALKPQPSQTELYREWLRKTDPATSSNPEMDSSTELAAIERFIEFYRVYSADHIRKHIRDVYATECLFVDPFKSVSGIVETEAYFVKMSEGAESCAFTIHQTDRCKGEYYFRWTMELVLKRKTGERILADGMSHVRFSSEGKVVFQHDYWDTGLLFERLPLLKTLIRYVKNRLEK